MKKYYNRPISWALFLLVFPILITQSCSSTTQTSSDYGSFHSTSSLNPVNEYDPNDLTISVSGVSFTMKRVDGGTFNMGSQKTNSFGRNYDKEADDDESPVHQVTINDFYIGKYEVTQQLWEAVMSNNPSVFKGDNLPVENVTWFDCLEFIEKLNRITNRHFRLPTEAEWEYAAKGGKKSQGFKYSGSNRINDVAWYDGNSGNRSHPVGRKLPNELGIYDMTGNVAEWCSDWYGNYSSNSQANPKGPSNGKYRISRGGNWCNPIDGCRVVWRARNTPDSRKPRTGQSVYGLRLVLDF